MANCEIVFAVVSDGFLTIQTASKTATVADMRCDYNLQLLIAGEMRTLEASLCHWQRNTSPVTIVYLLVKSRVR